MKTTKQNQHLHNALLEVIQNQLDNNEPKETRETLDRLIAEGHTEAEAMDLISHVVAAEVIGVLSEGRTYDESLYLAALHALPTLPGASKHKKQTP
jgi:hypothetical protein